MADDGTTSGSEQFAAPGGGDTPSGAGPPGGWPGPPGDQQAAPGQAVPGQAGPGHSDAPPGWQTPPAGGWEGSPGGWQTPPPGGWEGSPGGWQRPPPGGWEGSPGAWQRPQGPWDQGPGPWQGAPGWYGGPPGGWQARPAWSPPGPGPYPGYGTWGPGAGTTARRRVRSPEERRRRFRLSLIVAGVLVLAVGAGIGIGAWIAPSNPAVAAKGLVGKAVTAASQAGSFHYVEVSTADGNFSRFVGDAGPNGGRQLITTTGKSGTDVFALRLVGGTVYFKGNAPAVVDQLSVPATKATTVANHWVKVVKGDAPYKTLAEGITAKSNISQLSTTFVAHSSVSVQGSSPAATRVVGAVKSTGHVLPGSADLVMATSSSLPERFTAQSSTATFRLAMRWTFGHYHEKVSVAVPATSEPYSSLGATPPSSGG